MDLTWRESANCVWFLQINKRGEHNVVREVLYWTLADAGKPCNHPAVYRSVSRGFLMWPKPATNEKQPNSFRCSAVKSYYRTHLPDILEDSEKFLLNFWERASILNHSRRCDGIGRRSGFKIRRQRWRVGSSPTTGTMISWQTAKGLVCQFLYTECKNSLRRSNFTAVFLFIEGEL